MATNAHGVVTSNPTFIPNGDSETAAQEDNLRPEEKSKTNSVQTPRSSTKPCPQLRANWLSKITLW